MAIKMALLVVFCIASAQAAGFFQRAAVISMQTTECIAPHRSVLNVLAGTTDIQRELCAEYIMVSPSTIFRVQASKSAPLLLPAEEVNFRRAKGSLVVRRDDQQDDFEVKVVCMQLRSSSQATCTAPTDVSAVSATNPP